MKITEILKPKSENQIINDIQRLESPTEQFASLFIYYFKKQIIYSDTKNIFTVINEIIFNMDKSHISLSIKLLTPKSIEIEYMGITHKSYCPTNTEIQIIVSSNHDFYLDKTITIIPFNNNIYVTYQLES